MHQVAMQQTALLMLDRMFKKSSSSCQAAMLAIVYILQYFINLIVTPLCL